MISSPLTFPSGRLGLGLLVARMAVAGEGLASAAQLGVGGMSLATLLAGALICGFATRTSALIVAAAAAWLSTRHIPTPALHLLGSAVPLAMTGPGAWSVDARLFGRRVVRLGRAVIGDR